MEGHKDPFRIHPTTPTIFFGNFLKQGYFERFRHTETSTDTSTTLVLGGTFKRRLEDVVKTFLGLKPYFYFIFLHDQFRQEYNNYN